MSIQHQDTITRTELVDEVERLRNEGDDTTADLLEQVIEEADSEVVDFKYDEPLIRYSYFTKYCIELLQDCGDLPSDLPWYIVVDEEATAENLKADYTEIDVLGVTYYGRAG